MGQSHWIFFLWGRGGVFNISISHLLGASQPVFEYKLFRFLFVFVKLISFIIANSAPSHLLRPSQSIRGILIKKSLRDSILIYFSVILIMLSKILFRNKNMRKHVLWTLWKELGFRCLFLGTV